MIHLKLKYHTGASEILIIEIDLKVSYTCFLVLLDKYKETKKESLARATSLNLINTRWGELYFLSIHKRRNHRGVMVHEDEES